MKNNLAITMTAFRLWEAFRISEKDLSQKDKEVWLAATSTWMAGGCTMDVMKKKPYLPIIEFKVGTPVLTMVGLKEEINDLRREVNELKKRRQV